MKFEVFASREKKPDFVSKEIMKKIGCDWSHNGIIYTDDLGFERIFHAIGSGVSDEHVSDFLEKREFVHRIDVTDRMKTSPQFSYGWLWGRKGTEYSQSQYIGFLLPFMKKFIRNGTHKVICSEFVYEFCVTTGVLKFRHFPKQDYVDPKMIIEALI
jgi:hypothetical protein